MAINPAWRKSLVYTTLGTKWPEGANLTEINAARQLLIQDMKIIEGIAPGSGAYLNEVRLPDVYPKYSDSRTCMGIGIRIQLEEIFLRHSLR